MIDELENPRIPEHRNAGFPQRLSAEDYDRLVTWLDLNGVYYPYYESAYPDSLTGRTPMTVAELARLGQLAGIDAEIWSHHETGARPVVSFDRPERSPILAAVLERAARENNIPAEEARNTPDYQEALNLIRLGQKRLKERPRADMDGFVPCDRDRQRLEKAERLRAKEMKFREAIRRKERMSDREEPQSF